MINVITKSGAETQGGLVGAGGSRFEKSGVVRYGGELSNGGHYCVYGKYADNDDLRTEAGRASLTGWHRTQSGFRTDWGSTSQNFTLQGDAFDARLHQQGTDNIKISGANLNGKMNRTLHGGSTRSLQAY